MDGSKDRSMERRTFCALQVGRTLPWLPLWVLALVGIAASLVAGRGHMRVNAAGGAGVIARAGTDTLVVSVLVLLGVLALRAAVIFSGQ